MIDEQTILLTRQWRQNHPDEEPEFHDLLSIQQRSSMTADELLTSQYREELLIVVGEGSEAEQEQPTAPDTRPLSQRWVEDMEHVDASEESLALVDALWGHRAPRWVVLAASLIEVWTIEGRRLPDGLDDELVQEVERLVDARAAAGDALMSSLRTEA